MPAVIPPVAMVAFNAIFQILILSAVFFYFYRLFGGTRSAQLFIGGIGVMVSVMLLFALAKLFELDVLDFFLGKILMVIATAVVVVFQPELRQTFLSIGSSRRSLRGREARDKLVDAIGEAAETLSMQQPRAHGALIVVERNAHLLEFAQKGTQLNIPVSAAIMTSIFYPGAPLHDGAIIIRGDTILAARCILPLSETDTGRGTRHRAALGISESSDAIAVVVSEETRQISVAVSGNLVACPGRERLEKLLRHLIRSEADFETARGKSQAKQESAVR